MPRSNRSRRNDEGIDWEAMFQTFRHAPWWAGPLAAGGVLVLFFLILPMFITAIGSTGEMTEPVSKILRPVVRIIGALFAVAILIVWGFAMVCKPFDRKRLDTQRGPETIDTLTWQQFELLLAEAMRRRGYGGTLTTVLSRMREREPELVPRTQNPEPNW